MIGVSVVVKGTTNGTITDLDGNFSISVSQGQNQLEVSYVGYETKTVNLANKTYLTIQLDEDTQLLDEVVVVGYGTMKKRDLTGSVSSVKSSDITLTPTSNALEAIQGKIPGMDIVRESGSAGSGVKIMIRGTKTLGFTDSKGEKIRNTDPLFIIDGVQGGSYEDLNPADIESIDVLKDASSTAIYGSQGANGVVIITTKKGKEAGGKITVTYDGYFGINGWADYPDPRMGDSYIQLRREAYRTENQWSSPADDINIFSPEEWEAIQNNQWVNWVDLVTRTGTQQSHNVTLSSGTEKVKSYISAAYYNEKGIFKNDEMSRFSLRVNLDYTANKWLKVGVSSQVTYTEHDRVPSKMLTNAMIYTPLGTPYNEDGSINLFPVSGDTKSLSPLANYSEKNKAEDNKIAGKIFAVGYMEIQPIKQLKFRSNLAASFLADRRGVYNAENSTDQYGESYKNQATMTQNFDRFYTWDNVLTFNESFGDHNVEATLVSSWTKNMEEDYYSAGVDQMLNSFLYYNLGATQTDGRIISSGYKGYQNMGYVGRLSYNYKSKYLLTVSGRYDGSSRLSPGHRWDFFPAAAAAWRVSDEAFMEGTKNWLSNLKLRLSYGETGNSGIPPYGTQSGEVVASSKFGFNDIGSMVYLFNATVGNPYLGWETSASTNLGFDIGFLNNRINLVLDLYNIDTKSVLMARHLPPSTGAGSTNSQQFVTNQNIGKTNNKGIEIALNTDNIRTKDFKWSSTLTFAVNKEKIVDLVDGVDIIDSQNPERASLLIGRPINSFYSYKLNGIWQLGQESEMAKYKLNGTENAFSPGDLRVEDTTDDFNITSDDRTYLGSEAPKWTAGFNNTFSYKGIDLSIYLYARWGQMIDAEFLGRYNPSGIGNSPGYFNYWTPENPSNDFPRPKMNGNLFDNFGYMSLKYVDGSFLKIKNVSLGYTIPKKLISKWNISNLKVYATASNLFTFSKSHLIKHYDPERGGSEKSPLSKQLVFGVNFSF